MSCQGKKGNNTDNENTSETEIIMTDKNDENTKEFEDTEINNIIPYGMDDNDKNLEELLGQWYEIGDDFYEFYDFDENRGFFEIIRNEDLFVLKFTIYSRLLAPYSYSTTGTIQREHVIEANKKYYSKYKMIANDDVYNFYIRYNFGNIFGKEINVCSLSIPNMPDPWDFVKKDEVIRKVTIMNGYINDSDVRIREDYGLSGKVIKILNKGEKVDINGVSPALEVINGHFQNWFKVTTVDGLNGWVYGNYLSFNGIVLNGNNK